MSGSTVRGAHHLGDFLDGPRLAKHDQPQVHLERIILLVENLAFDLREVLAGRADSEVGGGLIAQRQNIVLQQAEAILGSPVSDTEGVAFDGKYGGQLYILGKFPGAWANEDLGVAQFVLEFFEIG